LYIEIIVSGQSFIIVPEAFQLCFFHSCWLGIIAK
jgi:hypothetical protein